ncbi:type II secretion system secretin GspD [Rhodanobacter sp. AS-Z3]|uniref:type II secretion system secretin GspD n=1 Tax=Rhodanobacter sp. AS-Z3 TaxID=3031330 RepID=UPI00247A93A9|nr:type II secretion system secretin GspD [Rhodanobacter sp. AS-Z3]WEN15296.1 type II secretion system secretin GspD [Rhodanobacter sp. AS-Z3]
MFRTLTQQTLRVATLAFVVGLSGCASLPKPHDDGALQREAMAGTHNPVPAPLPLNTDVGTGVDAAAAPEISRGSGQFIHPHALATPRRAASGSGAVTFNFENQPVQAVVKAILGDLLKQNYTIVPGVQGNISFSTSEPVDSGQALPILETLLGWTGNALVHRDGGYVVMPQKDAVAGNLVPSLGATAPQGGLQARLFPLRYISATEMQKLIKPFARTDATLLADPARNLLVMSGTPQELANYQSMVRTFDVDWLRGMSVGVFNLQYAKVGELMPKLDGMFGVHGDTPLAGMLRFIPIERTNALVVISTQPDYLQEVGDWIARIDRGGGNEPQLFVYDVRNIKASDLAKYLANIYTNGGGSSGGGDNGGQVGPGLTSATLGSSNGAGGMSGATSSFGNPSEGARDGGVTGTDSSGGFNSGGGRDAGGSAAGGGFGSSSGSFGGNTAGASAAANDQQYSSSDGSVRISSVDSNNQLLVRARPAQWEEIKSAISQLDNVPMQVQIETRILEVNLTGEFQFGVQWYLEGLTGSTTDSSGNLVPGQPNNPRQIGLGKGGNAFGGEPFFYSFLNSNLQVAVRAMETSGNTKTLSAPSMVVMNNQTASIEVGNKIPINQTSVNTGIGTASTYSQVSYLNTGVILNVQPRINPGGLVYMNISQEVSQADRTVQLVNGNPAISQRKLATQVAVQSGQTVLLGGLIEQAEGNTDTGIPGLNRIPVLGRLFGSTNRSRNRTELIVLITPRVIRGGADAKQITDDYQSKFESLAPLRASGTAAAAATMPVAPPPAPALGWPEQMQHHAEIALGKGDDLNAQNLAIQSWQQGAQRGALCERNWQLVLQVRQHAKDPKGADLARKRLAGCRAPATSP